MTHYLVDVRFFSSFARSDIVANSPVIGGILSGNRRFFVTRVAPPSAPKG
jgi:hypothetical protein